MAVFITDTYSLLHVSYIFKTGHFNVYTVMSLEIYTHEPIPIIRKINISNASESFVLPFFFWW